MILFITLYPTRRFYAYKLPKQFPVVGATQGTEFLYMKPGVTDWTLSPVTIEFGNSMIGLTLAQAYANAVSLIWLYIYYNVDTFIDDYI